MMPCTQIFMPLFAATLLVTAGCTSYPRQLTENNQQSIAATKPSPKKLGTAWGEDLHSSVQSVKANRLSQSPYNTLTIHYRGETVPKDLYTQTMIALPPIGVRVINEMGRPMSIYRDQQGRYILPAFEGMRYTLQLTNHDIYKTYEVVTTVDGLDVLNGQAGSYQNSGYLVRPGKQIEIDGFRKSSQQVAAFRFAAPQDSYANQNRQGDERNIGVIGMAIFEVQEELPDCEASPFPAETKYAPAPCNKR